MTITSLFYRFLKERNIYVQTSFLLKYCFLKLDNLDDFLSNGSFIVLYNNINWEESINEHQSLFYETINIINNDWNTYRTYCKHLIEPKPRHLDITLATELLEEFTNIYNIKNKVLHVLYEKHKIEELSDNVIDECLYKNSVSIDKFFISAYTFGKWMDYNFLLNTAEYRNGWLDIHYLWRDFLHDRNIKNIIL